MPLVRNRQPGPTVLDDRTTDVVINWEGAGHPMGEDVQEVPPALMQHAGLVRAMRKGVLEVVPEDEIDPGLFARQAERFAETSQAQHAAVMDTLEESSRDKDLLEVRCMISGEPVIMSERELQERPPLAERFADRAGEFVATETGKLNAQGKPVITWSRVTIGEALPSQ